MKLKKRLLIVFIMVVVLLVGIIIACNKPKLKKISQDEISDKQVYYN